MTCEELINKFEPETDEDTKDLGDGIETCTPSLLDRVYNSIRRMPLRKLLTLIVFISDLIITAIGFLFQLDFPSGILSSFQTTKISIYGFYFSSSAVEGITDKIKNCNDNNKTISFIKDKLQKAKIEKIKNEDKYIDCESGKEIPIVQEINEEP